MENLEMTLPAVVDGHLKVLMLEDSESDAGLVLRVLKKANLSYEYIRIDSKEEFMEALENYNPDLVLSDHSMPQFNSIEAYRIFKQHKLSIPFILITGSVSEEFAVRCLHEGIDDYILKNNLTRLPTAIQQALQRKTLERKKKELEKEQQAINERLKRQNEELAKANKELDRFVYSASHELRGPLASMLGLIELSTLDLASDKCESIQMYLQMMGMSINRLNLIAEEIVNYSLNNRTDVACESVEIYELLGKVFDKLSYIPGIDDVKRIIDIKQDYPWYGDKRRLMTIFDNLIANAVHFRNVAAQEPFVCISIEVREYKVLIRIEDNGIGINDAYLGQIFEMFFRLSASSQGAGLGLYIVKETLEKLEGSITVQSELGKGSSFTVEIKNLTP